MMWSNYKETSHHGFDGVGILEKNMYVFTRKIKPCLDTHFWILSEEEYRCYGIWKDNQNKLDELCARPICYIGYYRSAQFREF